MSPAVLALVLLAAACHAGWNLLAKESEGGTGFVWLGAAAGSLIYLPVVAVALAIDPGPLGWTLVGFMAVSGALHAVYFVLLQRGYRDGDLSYVYPLARGTGPLLATVIAIAALGERPSALALVGAAVIVGSVLSLVSRSRGSRPGAGGQATLFALLTGTAIASYTLWDKQAVGPLALSPIVYYWGTQLANLALLTPWVIRRPAGLRAAWSTSRARAAGVGLLSPAAYILVLFALAHAPVSYVAPARETSILMATVLGATVLAEGDRWRRIAAAAGVLVGLLLLAIG